MNPNPDYLTHNRQLWNQKTQIHVASSFYDIEGFKNGHNPLNSIELELLGEIKGKKILHLQCHFGMDTLALARLGAEVTGLDFSETAIQTAQSLAEELNLPARFVCSDLYSAKEVLNEKFDLVFTSYGTIGWLPDLEKWAEIVQHFLVPKGKFVFAEFHPVVWMFDDSFTHFAYSYFNQAQIIETSQGTYADRKAEIALTSITWNHDLGEVLGNLLKKGLRLTHFSEYDYSPYNCMENMVEIAPQKYQIKGMEAKIPMVYALVAEKE